jgi:hypothetical protein
MFAALRALPLLYRLLTIAGIVAALGGSVWGLYAYVKHEGYVDGYADATARCEAEKKAMEDANRAAIDAANKALMRAADAYSLKSLELDDALKSLDDAAVQDADAARQCLSAGSVRRLNAIQ